MNSFASVAAITDLVSKSYKQIDIVVLNAGLYNLQYSTSPSGWEEILQVSTLFTTLLALLLLPVLRATKKKTIHQPPHLVLVSSGQHTTVSPTALPPPPSLILSSFKAPPTPTHLFNDTRQYTNSKLLFMYALNPLAPLATSSDGEPQVIVTSRCPGFCVSWLCKVGSVVPDVGHVGFLQGI